MDTLRGIECFVKAVEGGSIAAAARRLGISAAGGGVTRLAVFVANEYLRRGELVELFTKQECSGFDMEVEPLDLYACVRDRHQLTPKVRAFMDYLQEALPAEWRAVESNNVTENN